MLAFNASIRDHMAEFFCKATNRVFKFDEAADAPPIASKKFLVTCKYSHIHIIIFCWQFSLALFCLSVYVYVYVLVLVLVLVFVSECGWQMITSDPLGPFNWS